MTFDATVQAGGDQKARSRLSARLHEARARLTRNSARPAQTNGPRAQTPDFAADQGPDVPPDYRHDLLSMFARNELAARATIILLAGIFSLASMFWAPWSEALLWLLLVIAAKVALLERCRRFLLAPQSDTALWYRRLIVAEAFNGLAWAGFALVGMDTPGGTSPGYLFSSHAFIFASLIVVLAIRGTFASYVMPIFYVGTLPMTLVVVIRLVMLDDPFYLALAAMAVGAHVYFIFLAKGLTTTAVAMLNLRAQKDELIAELEEAKAISDEARRRAEGANLAKSRFLATMSHELRTPLNAILGFSEVMQTEIMGPLNNPTYKDYAGNIHDSGSHLLKLINEILDLSRIEAGRYDLHEEAVRIVDVVEDCHRLLKLRADTKNLSVIERYEDGLHQIWADERAMRQICLNLLSNALKFTPRGGQIILSVGNTPDGGQFINVRDNGPGIPKEEIPKILQPFGQGSLAQQTAEGGTGLGLPIVQSLVDLHGGSLEIRSELRKGTEAIVRLPRKRVLNPMQSAPQFKRDVQRPTAAPARTGRPARLKTTPPPVPPVPPVLPAESASQVQHPPAIR